MVTLQESPRVLFLRRQALARLSSDRLFGAVERIGGENGWYYADWLWQLRGLMDRCAGGIGCGATAQVVGP